MILSSAQLDTLDRCPRRFAFERDHETRSISPVGLLYAAIEGSATSSDPIAGAREAILERTARLDVNAGDLNPLSAARHVTATAEVIALALRERLGQASRVPDVDIGGHRWRSNLFECRGELHRLVLASHMDDDTLRSFAHSWGTIGELAALERPLTLTVVLIGSQRNGRRHSHWTKASQHPVQKSVLRFAARKRDDGFTANWKLVWREQTEIGADEWLKKMRSDDVLDELIVSRKIRYSGGDERMLQARRDIVTLAEMAASARTSDPMRRSSCDEIGRGACPWQPCCYAATPTGPQDLPGLYRPRSS